MRISNRDYPLFYHYAIYIAILGVAILLTTLINVRILRDSTYEVTRSDLHAVATLAKNLMPATALEDGAAAERFCQEAAANTGTRITVILPDGEVLGDSAAKAATMENHWDRPEIRAALGGQVGVSVRYSETVEHVLMYAALPVLEEGRIVGVLRTSLMVADIEELLAELYRKIAIVTLALLLVALVASILLSRSLRGPIKALHEGALSYSRGELDAQLPPGGPRELRELAVALQTMARQLKHRIRDLDAQRQETEEVLNTIREPLVLLDSELRLLRLNVAATRLAAVDALSLLGKPILEAFRNAEVENFARALAKGEEPEETVILHYGPHERYLSLWGVKLSSEGSILQGNILMLLRDVTRERRIEQIRRDFVANVSHELKTPLTMIKGAVETLEELSPTDEEARQRFEGMIANHSERMSAIIEDLLSLSRIEQNELSDVPRRKLPVREIVSEALSAVEPFAEERSTKLTVQVPEALSITAHPALLTQAVTNLLDNAIKYSDPEGEVRVFVRKEEQEILIEVTDSGWGIPLRDQERVFERFYRVDRSRSRERGGTGLGLAIVRHVAKLHGGEVTLESEPGSGSSFVLRIPGGEA